MEENLDKIVSFCKRKGFVFQSSEIYGGFAAVYDYGPYGALLKNNIRDAWLKQMLQSQNNIVVLDSAIFMHPLAWKASGHLDNFDDPQIDCKKCKNRMRADQVLESFGINADKAPLDFINSELDKLRKAGKLKCPVCGSKDITPAKRFSLMVKSNLGSPTESLNDSEAVYLRPETCGGIYLNYKNILDSTRVKIPFGVAQVGKAFRNEIVARQFIFRTREFEQMEMQYFLHPSQMKEKYEEWRNIRYQWYLEYGIEEKDIQWHRHEKLAHYASEAYDIEYDFKCIGGFKEVEGIHARGNWDLSQHSKFSGADLSYHDENGEKFIPHILETSAGLNRFFLMFIDKAYTEEAVNGETRVVLKLDPRLAPIKAAIFPLLKNKLQLKEKAQEVYNLLKLEMMCEYDDSGNIGKSYRRQDEIGTPYCITIDFDTLEDNTVTVRDRDTMQQERIKIDNLVSYLLKNLQ
ncbi:MAG TPA: glycine--tRNA ligase [Candidatus Pacearchaeota archaeon]|nr:glycine--tRNA ligase [Candidatus Pacearchaeota archaeon]HRR94638.1 glycine--tRNA ligase [Candidatus Paceibacterota bacterium]HPC30344.1 glycine--tRNA ligase [Candidatus Pacearchaeota archaeon]HQG09034.1 glycine--tRNA ligase [Candidatus Pacearchaeota archaeon]HQH20015.1 glycine--tRNA ligase [Candidatus Pacearchaeota archaeon]